MLPPDRLGYFRCCARIQRPKFNCYNADRSVIDGLKYYSEKEPAIQIRREIFRENKMAAITLREVCEDIKARIHLL